MFSFLYFHFYATGNLSVIKVRNWITHSPIRSKEISIYDSSDLYFFDNIDFDFAWADASVDEIFYGLKRVNLHISSSGMVEAPLSRLQQYLSIVTTVGNHVFDLNSEE